MASTNSRIGFHYYTDSSHYSEADLAAWLPVLQAHGAGWLVLRSRPGSMVPDAFLRGLIEAGIRPVVWMHSPIAQARAKDLAVAFNRYHAAGVGHVVVFDRPNQQISWPAEGWARGELVERFVDKLLPILQIQRAVGLHPTFPPLEPGGDYWDTAFLEAALQSMMRRGHHDLLREMHLAVYAWTHGRALDWGAGGAERWPTAAPYQTPQDMQDQRGIRIFDWYAEILLRTLGTSLPMLAISGGALGSPDQDLGAYAKSTQQLVRAVQAGELSEMLLAFAFFPLVSEPGAEQERFAWYAGPTQPRPVAQALSKRHPSDVKRPPVKAIAHYMLLDSTQTDIASISSIAQAEEAVIGFSAKQAQLAKRVTLVGAIPASIERSLRRCGVEVVRIRQIEQHQPASIQPDGAKVAASA